MKKIQLLATLLVLNLLYATTFAQTPSGQASNVVFSNIQTNQATVAWTGISDIGVQYFVFIKQGIDGTALPVNGAVYTANTVFGSGSQIGTSGWFCVYQGSGTSAIVSGLNYNTNYRVMVCTALMNSTTRTYSYNTTTATNNPNNFITASGQASQITFSNVVYNKFTVSWVNGVGTKRAVFVKVASTGNPIPVNNTTYTANTTFKSGTQIGTSGWYCVYNGTGSSVTVTGLTRYTTYRVMVCEYTGAAGAEVYNTTLIATNPLNRKTPVVAVPTTQAAIASFSNVTANNLTINLTNGNGEKRIVFLAKTTTGNAIIKDSVNYTANASFGSGTQIDSSGWYCIYNGTGSSVVVSNLELGTTYRAVVYEYNGSTSYQRYLTTITATNVANQTTGQAQATNIQVSSITYTGATIKFVGGSGTKRAVFVRNTSSGTPVPVNNVTYTGNTIFKSGTQIGTSGWYCVYNGTGTSFTLSGLLPAKTYRIMVCEYTGAAGAEVYNTTVATANPYNFTSKSVVTPTVQSNSLTGVTTTSSATINFLIGNGEYRIAFVKQGTTGTPLPVDNVNYTANSAFGLGSQIDSSGWFCVYAGTGSSFSVSGLSPETNYIVMVCEYNGPSSYRKYLKTTAVQNPLTILTQRLTSPIALKTTQLTTSKVQLYAYGKNIYTQLEQDAYMEVYTLTGTLVFAGNIKAGSTSTNINSVSGNCLVRLYDNNEVINKLLFIE